jgi:hypothetical protein
MGCRWSLGAKIIWYGPCTKQDHARNIRLSPGPRINFAGHFSEHLVALQRLSYSVLVSDPPKNAIPIQIQPSQLQKGKAGARSGVRDPITTAHR